MKASNLRERNKNICLHRAALGSSTVAVSSKPVFGVESKTEAVSDSSCSALPLEGAGLRNKGLHQRAHLAALVISKEHRRLISKKKVKKRRVSSDRLMVLTCFLLSFPCR